MLAGPLKPRFLGPGGYCCIIIRANIWVLTVCKAPFKGHRFIYSPQCFYVMGTTVFLCHLLGEAEAQT